MILANTIVSSPRKPLWGEHQQWSVEKLFYETIDFLKSYTRNAALLNWIKLNSSIFVMYLIKNIYSCLKYITGNLGSTVLETVMTDGPHSAS